MTVKFGDIIKLHYVARTEEGNEFDSSLGKEPIQFQVGAGRVIEGIEEGVVGLEAGDKKELTVTPEKGFGEWRNELLQTVPKKNFPEQEFAPGQTVRLETTDGRIILATVGDVDDQSVTFDLNHPLAGKILRVEIEVVEVLE